jgi:SAM-dependent methyltransferase
MTMSFGGDIRTVVRVGREGGLKAVWQLLCLKCRGPRDRVAGWLRRALFGASYCGEKTIRSFDVDEARAIVGAVSLDEHSRAYNRERVPTYLATMEYLAGFGRDTRVLEIGACPYGMSLLMRRYLFDSVTTVSYAGPDRRNFEGRDVRLEAEGAEAVVLREYLFDAETDAWPFVDGSFDLVLLCHVIEHFARDPMHAIAEANRVLSANGHLFVSAPNVLSAHHLDGLLVGRPPNICPFYRYKITDRHNRELTPAELRVLCESGGFETEMLECASLGMAGEARLRTLLAILLTQGTLAGRRETLAGLFRKTGPVRDRYPLSESLYCAEDRPLWSMAPSREAPNE